VVRARPRPLIGLTLFASKTMLALGLVVAPAAILLLQLGLAPDEFQHSPKVRILALAVVCFGGMIWLGSELGAAFARPKALPTERPAA